MPANQIIINGHFEYIVEDSKMEEALEFLAKVSTSAKSIIQDLDKELVELGNLLTGLKNNDTNALLNMSRRLTEIAISGKAINYAHPEKGEKVIPITDLVTSLEGRIKFYKENNELHTASALEILLRDMMNNDLLSFMEKG